MKISEREEIIKMLERWSSEYGCTGCPLIDQGCFDCGHIPVEISRNILTLIKELTEEIKSLEADYDRVYEQAEADIRGNMADGGTSCHWCMDKTKADTVKSMWHKIDTNHRISTVHYVGHAEPTITYEFTNWELDQMVKEILED